MPFIASAQDDKLCEHLISFASKSKVAKPLKVILINDWANFSKSCEDNGTEEGKEFCNYLINNTSTEFMNINLSRILNCSVNDFNLGSVHLNKISGEFSVFEIPSLNQDITLNINFSIGDDVIKDFIEIEAENEPEE
ncbi:hypothetical protein CWC30_14975 [Pseudoalteromonas sp. S4741]|uniref:hypothetical protein n=2 Tax=Pseudoalteromonas TaxID=53246 RepID=UPI001282F1FD|nr:hypothetical protein [Pseudoalteromonas sp. 5Ae-yellow]TMO21311.1 hypothetical protein CWC30_14975 [Pseudoalteromonas sp. S4741]